MVNFFSSQAKGKIVVFNEKWIRYGKTVAYRDNAAVEVAKVGGLASLIRSVTPFSINSPHTGWQYYQKGKLIYTHIISPSLLTYLMSQFFTVITLVFFAGVCAGHYAKQKLQLRL